MEYSWTQIIRTWFYNHYDHPHCQIMRFTRRWSGWNVFYYENKENIMKLTQKVSKSAPGSKKFFSALQKTITTLWKEVPGDEQDRYAERAKEWSKNRPPKDIQAKYVPFQDFLPRP